MIVESTYSRFVADMHAGRVCGVTTKDGQRFPIKPLERNRSWDMENFDFGDLLDPSHSDFLGLQSLSASTVHRRPDRAYVCRLSGTTYLFVKRFDVRGHHDDDDNARFYIYVRCADGIWESADNLLLSYEWLIILADNALANRQRIEVQQTARCRLPSRTVRTPSSVQGATVIRLSQASYVRHNGGGHGSEKRPHVRRSHTRRLRSGRTIPVRASSIRGGSRAGSYVVKK